MKSSTSRSGRGNRLLPGGMLRASYVRQRSSDTSSTSSGQDRRSVARSDPMSELPGRCARTNTPLVVVIESNPFPRCENRVRLLRFHTAAAPSSSKRTTQLVFLGGRRMVKKNNLMVDYGK